MHYVDPYGYRKIKTKDGDAWVYVRRNKKNYIKEHEASLDNGEKNFNNEGETIKENQTNTQ
jgi:hypothetical protein